MAAVPYAIKFKIAGIPQSPGAIKPFHRGLAQRKGFLLLWDNGSREGGRQEGKEGMGEVGK